jgi:outer membrane protein assembly factor BamB
MLPVRRAQLVAAAVPLALVLFALSHAAEEWSRFRGPNGSGVSFSTGLPVEFSPENKAWEASVPFARSSPAVSGDRIFLTAVVDGKLVTLALDRGSGKTLWRRELERNRAADLYSATDSATPTPVTDGSNVYVFFHEAGLVSYDGKGNERWRVRLGPFHNFYGVASSPVLGGKTLFLLCDQAQGSFLLAVNKDTGKELWRRNRPARFESYSTPILYPDADKPRAIIVSGSNWVDAYDPATGKSVWSLGGVGSGPVSSPVFQGDILFINAQDHAEHGWSPFSEMTKEHDADKNGTLSMAEVEGSWLANHFGWLDNDSSGTISAEDWEHLGEVMSTDNWGVFAIRIPGDEGKPEILWNYRQNVPNIPSPLIYEDVFYIVKDGIVTSLEPKTGKLLKRGRLGDGSPKVYASPVAADGKIYFSTMEGQVAVVDAGPEWTVLATNELDEEIWASPAIVDGNIYVRTKEKLYSFCRGQVVERSSPP